jgi:hypothetical protein
MEMTENNQYLKEFKKNSRMGNLHLTTKHNAAVKMKQLPSFFTQKIRKREQTIFYPNVSFNVVYIKASCVNDGIG